MEIQAKVRKEWRKALNTAHRLCLLEQEFYDNLLDSIVEQYEAEPALLIGTIVGWVETLTNQQQDRLEQLLLSIYDNTNIELLKQLKAVSAYNPNLVREALQADWGGNRHYSKSIWNNRQKLIDTLPVVIGEHIAMGRSVAETADALNKIIDNSKFNTTRLIITETAHIYNQSSIDTYKQAGVKECRVMGRSGDCPVNSIVDLNDAIVGDTIPPFHPFCKCTVVPIL